MDFPSEINFFLEAISEERLDQKARCAIVESSMAFSSFPKLV